MSGATASIDRSSPATRMNAPEKRPRSARLDASAARRACTSRPSDGSHFSAPSASAKEPIAPVGLEPRHARSGGHLDLLQDLAGFRIDPADVALLAFPCGVPELLVHPADSGDETVGFERAQNRPGVGIDLMDLPNPDTDPPRASLRATRAPSRCRRAPGS
jgi:hypothetical protein